jgi:hypothetical protein
MSCQFCPVGKYQESPGATSCTGCGSGKTTQTFGSYSSSDCKGQYKTRERYYGVISVCSFTTLNWKKIDNDVDRNKRETDTSSSMETGDMR